jgi:hypothetical protein
VMETELDFVWADLMVILTVFAMEAQWEQE